MWKTSTEISDAIFHPLKTWAEESTSNWNMLVGIGFVWVFISLILLFVLFKKMGKADERTKQIQLRSALMMLLIIIFCDIFFPKEYMWQIFFLFKYAIAFFVTVIYLTLQYRRDFS